MNDDELAVLRAQLDANLGLTPKLPKPKPQKLVIAEPAKTLNDVAVEVAKSAGVPLIKISSQGAEKVPGTWISAAKEANFLVNFEAALIKKYPKAPLIAGKARRTSEGLFVTIKCITCGKEREIHPQEAFQVTKCLDCKSKKTPKPKVTAESVAALAKEITKKEG